MEDTTETSDTSSTESTEAAAPEVPETALEAADAAAEGGDSTPDVTDDPASAAADPAAEEAPVDEVAADDPVAAFEAQVAAEMPRAQAPSQESALASQLAQSLAPVLKPIADQTQMLQNLLLQSAKQNQAARIAAQAPKMPDLATATHENMVEWNRQSLAFQQEQMKSQFSELIQNQQQQMLQEFRSTVAKLEQAQQEAAAQARANAYANAVNGLAARPGMQWLKDPTKQAILSVVYERAAGSGMSLSQVATELAKSFGLAPQATPKVAAAAQRNASTLALKDARAKAANSRAPLPGAGGKAGAAKKTVMQKLQDNKLWDALPADLKELYAARSGGMH